MRVPADISVYGGNFASQPLVFSYLWDIAPTLDLAEVEVICRSDPSPRLAHYFSADIIGQIDAALGFSDTCVLIFEQTNDAPAGTDLLGFIGLFQGHRLRPNTEET